MRFFEAQRRAKRFTIILSGCLALVVLLVSAVLYVVAASFIWTLILYFGREIVFSDPAIMQQYWQIALSPWIVAPFSLLALGVIFLLAYQKHRELTMGGVAVARALEAKRIYPSTKLPVEKTALNIVEEMAIASGIPTPLLFVLPCEQGINAFAAGLSHDKAVIGFTEGALEYLSREELQGVVAHEFSHIFNGDMLINMRLTAILYGLERIYRIGEWLMESSYDKLEDHEREYVRLNVDKDHIDRHPVFYIFGALLYATGSVGHIVAHLVRVAISRQREYLADASAVQFTRNPEALARALHKVRSLDAGSEVHQSAAKELCHFFFADAWSSSLEKLLATHPPIHERIVAINPGYAGEMEYVEKREDYDPYAGEVSAQSNILVGGGEISGGHLFDAELLLERIGVIRPANIEYAKKIVKRTPRLLLEAAHEPYGARALLLALLIHHESDQHIDQIDAVIQIADPHVKRRFRSLHALARKLPLAYHLPLLDIALPALDELSEEELSNFSQLISEVTKCGAIKRPFDMTLHFLMNRRLAERYAVEETPKKVTEYEIHNATHDLLQVLAVLGHTNEREAREAYGVAIEELNLTPRVFMPEPDEELLNKFAVALTLLQQASPKWCDRLAYASGLVALHDGKLTSDEGELIRAICECFRIPAPELPLSDGV